MSAEEIIKNFAIEVEGQEGEEDNILVFTLSTCQWCKKCKRFLNEKKMKYRYIEVDKIDPKDKAKILNYLKSTYQSRVSYPFLICEGGHVSGYNPNKYMELLKN
ncbi:MAG TPA: glutaredoxin family protein [bacterium]|nr:glutaredoxin family protein [bacterium]